MARQRIIGILSIANAAPEAFGARDTTLALGIARQAAVLEERQRLSRELHDSVTQALYGISLYTEAGGRRGQSDGGRVTATTTPRAAAGRAGG